MSHPARRRLERPARALQDLQFAARVLSDVAALELSQTVHSQRRDGDGVLIALERLGNTLAEVAAVLYREYE